jgi:hypothetical protein
MSWLLQCGAGLSTMQVPAPPSARALNSYVGVPMLLMIEKQQAGF